MSFVASLGINDPPSSFPVISRAAAGYEEQERSVQELLLSSVVLTVGLHQMASAIRLHIQTTSVSFRVDQTFIAFISSKTRMDSRYEAR
jgi:hypothetical protein